MINLDLSGSDLMEIRGGRLIKKLREESGLNQVEFATEINVSPRTLSRIENDKSKIDVLMFISIFEKFGNPTEDFWLLYLDSDEYGIYKNYKVLRRAIRDANLEQAKNMINEIESSGFIEKPFVGQYIDFAKVVASENLTIDEELNELWNIFYISNKDFNENRLSKMCLTYIEISIISTIASKLFKIGEYDRAIKILKDVIASRDYSRMTEEDRGLLYPMLMFNLSNFLGKRKKYKESLEICYRAIDIGIEYNNLRLIPNIWYNVAYNAKNLGEEIHILKTYLFRAYHGAMAIRNFKVANKIKEDAKKSFNIEL